MARSYIQRSNRRKGGILVREAAVQRGVASNSLYCVPVKGTVLALTSGVGHQNAVVKTAQHTLSIGSQEATALSVIRVSSIIVASESPFVVQVKNSAGTWTTYKVQGQKPTKIVCARVTSVLGNPALFNSNPNGATSGGPVVRIADNSHVVDMMVNCVVDGTLDDDCN